LEKIKEIMDKKIEVWREMRSGATSTASELFEGKMTPLTGEKKDDRRRIMEAAMRLFSKQGYSSTSEEEIADQAQVSMADFHEFFAGKEDLLLETAEEGVRVFNRRVSEEIAAVPDMLERIRIAIPVAFQILVENREIYTLYLEGSVLADTFYESKLMQNTASISYDLVATISRGIKDGSIRKVHPDIAANAIIGQLVRLANFWVEDPAKHNMGEITREAVEFVTRALSP
jgi:AcrR family transcriptional regulator